MSILFALVVRLWAAIILALMGVALVAAPIGAVTVEGRKPSTAIQVEGRKAPTLASFRRARKARRSPRRGAWLKRHPHATKTRLGQRAERAARTKTKAKGRASRAEALALKKADSHLAAQRGQVKKPTIAAPVAVVAEVFEKREKAVKVPTARTLARRTRAMQLKRGSGACHIEARKGLWYATPVKAAPVATKVEKVKIEEKRAEVVLTPKKVPYSPSQVQVAWETRENLRVEAKKATIRKQGIEARLAEEQAEWAFRVEKAKARATELKLVKVAQEKIEIPVPVTVDFQAAYEARQKAALKAEWDAATFVVAQARNLEVQASPCASTEKIEMRAAAHIQKVFGSMAAGICYLGSAFEASVSNVDLLLGLLLVGLGMLINRAYKRDMMMANIIDLAPYQVEICEEGTKAVGEPAPTGDCEIWQEHILLGRQMRMKAIQGQLVLVMDSPRPTTLEAFLYCGYCKSSDLQCGMIEIEVVDLTPFKVLEGCPFETLEYDDYLDGAAQLVSEMFDAQDDQGEEVEFARRSMASKRRMPKRIRAKVARGDRAQAMACADRARLAMQEKARLLQAKEELIESEKPALLADKVERRWTISSLEMKAESAGYDATAAILTQQEWLRSAKHIESPNEGRNSKRQQKDKLKSKAYRAARKMTFLVILALIIRSLDLGIEGLEMASFIGEGATGHALRRLRERFQGPAASRRIFEKLIGVFHGANHYLTDEFDGGQWLAVSDEGALAINNLQAVTFLNHPLTKDQSAMPQMRHTKALQLAQDCTKRYKSPARRIHVLSPVEDQLEQIKAGKLAKSATPMGQFMLKLMDMGEVSVDSVEQEVADAAILAGWVELNVVETRKGQVMSLTITEAGEEAWGILNMDEEEIHRRGWGMFFAILIPIAILFGAWYFDGLGEWAMALPIFTSSKPWRGAKWLEEFEGDEKEKSPMPSLEEFLALKTKEAAVDGEEVDLKGWEELWEKYGPEDSYRVPALMFCGYWDAEEGAWNNASSEPLPEAIQLLQRDLPADLKARLLANYGRCGNQMLESEQVAMEALLYSVATRRQFEDFNRKYLEDIASVSWLKAYGDALLSKVLRELSQGKHWTQKKDKENIVKENCISEVTRMTGASREKVQSIFREMDFHWFYCVKICKTPEWLLSLPEGLSSFHKAAQYLKMRSIHGDQIAECLVKAFRKEWFDMAYFCEEINGACNLMKAEAIAEGVMKFASSKLHQNGSIFVKDNGTKTPSRKEWLAFVAELARLNANSQMYVQDAWDCLSVCRKSSIALTLLKASGQTCHQLGNQLLNLHRQDLKNLSKWLEFIIRNGEAGWRISNTFKILEVAGYLPSISLSEAHRVLEEENLIDKSLLGLMRIGAPLDEESVHWHQELMKQAVPGPLPAGVLAEEPGYRLRVLDHKDITGPCLGFVITCCQCYMSQGESCARFGVKDPRGGFVVLEKKEKEDWKIVAQSFYWKSAQYAGRHGLCFDNVEYQAKAVYEEPIFRLYQKAADKIVTMGFSVVTIGSPYFQSDRPESWEIGVNLPQPAGFYSDAGTQAFLAGDKTHCRIITDDEDEEDDSESLDNFGDAPGLYGDED